MRQCEECEVDISHKRSDARFCSEKHRSKAERRRAYERNSDKEKEAGRRYRTQPHIRERAKQYREQPHNKERYRKLRKAWKLANPEKVAESRKKEKGYVFRTPQEVLKRKRISALKKAAAAVNRVFNRRIHLIG